MMNPSLSPRWAEKRRNKVLGVVLIVKNEVETLPAVFESIRELADEVVVGDTGSTDGTIALCKRWGVRLLHIRWRDDFACARNRVLDAASAPYLLRLDADEVMPRATAEGLARLRDEVLVRGEVTAYDFTVCNRSAGGAGNRHVETRIFPNRPDIRYQGAIHEEIATSLENASITRVHTQMEIHHSGYQDAATVRAKTERNEALLRQALARDPQNVHVLLHLAQALADRQELAEAETYLSETIELLARREGHSPALLAELHVLRAIYRNGAGNRVSARYDLDRARELAPSWALPDALQAERGVEADEWDAVAEALDNIRNKHFTPGTIAFPLARAESNVHLFQGYLVSRGERPGPAEHDYAEALRLDPSNLNARLAYGQALLGRNAGVQAREVLEVAGTDASAAHRFVDIAAAIGLARVLTGDEDGAAACLAPLLEIFAHDLRGAPEVGPIELAEVLLRAGYGQAAKNMITLFEHTAQAA